MAFEVVWSYQARLQLKKAYEYIKNDSVQNAEKVRTDILASTNKLSVHPEIYSLDKYRLANDGSHRAYELHRYRISYQISNTRILIVRLRHTKMQPKFY